MLREIFDRHGTDKGVVHDYDVAYERILQPYCTEYNGTEYYRDEPIVLLEIGVQKGHSLRAWAEYLPHGVIHGIDFHPPCRDQAVPPGKVFIGDQADPAFLHNTAKDIGSPVDIIIDDGGHQMRQQQVAFQTLWPYVQAGGVYVIEDLHTSYRQEGFASAGYPQTMEWLLDAVRKESQWDNHTKRYIPEWCHFFYKSLCAIYKIEV